MRVVMAFVAGALAVLVFHQGALALLHASGMTTRAPFAMTATEPLGVPQVVSLAFWGGVWGIVLWPLVARFGHRAWFWVAAIVLGAIAPSVVAWFVVAPLKGQPIASGWQPSGLALALLVNGAWGLGLAAFMRVAERFHLDEAGHLGTAAH